MTKAVESGKRALLKDLADARRDLLQAVAGIPAGREDEIFLGVWSIKDLLAHLAGWDATNLQAIQDILAGIPPSFFQYYDKDWQSYNARLVQENKVEPFSTLLLRVQESHARLMVFLDELPADKIVNGKVRRPNGRTVAIRNLLRSEAIDEYQHAEQVHNYLNSH
jgi:hypothetical protein